MNLNEITIAELIINGLDVKKIIVTREQKVNESIEKLEQKEVLNNWDKLSLTTKKAEQNLFSLSKISKVFIETGENILTENQKSCISFESIKTFVNESEKYKGKNMFTLNDVKLICNNLIKSNDKSTKLAIKVAKQGGELTVK